MAKFLDINQRVFDGIESAINKEVESLDHELSKLEMHNILDAQCRNLASTAITFAKILEQDEHLYLAEACINVSHHGGIILDALKKLKEQN